MDSFCNTDSRLFRHRCTAPEFHGEMFLKSFPAAHHANDFDRLVDDLHRWRTDRARAKAAADAMSRAVKGDPQRQRQFAKSLTSLEQATKAMRPNAAIIVKRATPSPAATIVKAFNTLQNDPSLTAHQRGTLMIKLGDLTDRVFAKAHPVADQITNIKEQIDRALANNHAKDTAVVIKHAKQLIASGKLTPPDHMRLTLLLNELRQKLEGATNGSKA